MKHRRFRSHRGLGLGGSESPLTEGVMASNIDSTSKDCLRVALWGEWRAMLEDLRTVGPVWSIVRNGHCILAVQGEYPELAFSPDQLTANACDGERSLTCYLPAWGQAIAFDSNCHCGRTRGLEFRTKLGEVFHRVCLAKGNNLTPFVEWVQMHQATGMETWTDEEEETEEISNPLQTVSLRPGTLQFAPDLLRTVLITAAQREIPLITSVTNDAICQTVQMDVQRASESQGWLVLSGRNRSLYVESEPTGQLYLEPGQLEGEQLWRLSLVGPGGHRLMRLQGGIEGRSAWNQLIREVVLCAPGLEL